MEYKFLSLDWFKSRVENSIDRVIANKIDSLIEEPAVKEQKIYEKPYFAIKLVNDTLTVVLADGTIITKPSATEDDYYAVQSARDLYEIHAVISSKEVKQNVEDMKAEAARIKALQKGIESLASLPDFIVEGNSVYLADTSLILNVLCRTN